MFVVVAVPVAVVVLLLRKLLQAAPCCFPFARSFDVPAGPCGVCVHVRGGEKKKEAKRREREESIHTHLLHHLRGKLLISLDLNFVKGISAVAARRRCLDFEKRRKKGGNFGVWNERASGAALTLTDSLRWGAPQKSTIFFAESPRCRKYPNTRPPPIA